MSNLFVGADFEIAAFLNYSNVLKNIGISYKTKIKICT